MVGTNDGDPPRYSFLFSRHIWLVGDSNARSSFTNWPWAPINMNEAGKKEYHYANGQYWIPPRVCICTTHNQIHSSTERSSHWACPSFDIRSFRLLIMKSDLGSIRNAIHVLIHWRPTILPFGAYILCLYTLWVGVKALGLCNMLDFFVCERP